MGKPRGHRAPDYDAKREALVTRLSSRVLGNDAARGSLAAYAEAAAVSVPTLRHYFGDRDGVVHAVLQQQRALSTRYVDEVATPSASELAASMRAVGGAVCAAWTQHGVGQVMTAALALGFHDETIGPRTVQCMLEPLIDALERRLAVHAQAGTFGGDTRVAALQFLSPLVVAMLHQVQLFGAEIRPLDVDAFLDEHAARFARAWAP